jgi:sec-independent protein translocase protein TatC
MKQKIQPKAQPEQATASKQTLESKSFSDHIKELRKRAFLVALVFIIASSLAYNYRDILVELIMKPLGDEKLIYLTPGGGFNFIFQVTLYAGLIAAAPMLIYQLYGFIRPALPARAQRSSIKVVIAAFVLMMCGVSFGYLVAVPSALNFLSTFAGTDVAASLTADSYLGFFLAYIAGLGVLFQLPLLLLFFHWIHPMTPGKLLQSEKFVILFAFVASAMITPTPDVLNQSMIAVPLIAIYQIGVVVVLFSVHKDHRKLQRQTRVGVVAKLAQDEKRIASPLPLVATSIQPAKVSPPVASVAHQASQQHRVTRGIDGFRASTRPAPPRPVTPQRPTLRQVPSRPVVTPYRRPLSIDGFMMS